MVRRGRLRGRASKAAKRQEAALGWGPSGFAVGTYARTLWGWCDGAASTASVTAASTVTVWETLATCIEIGITTVAPEPSLTSG